MSALVLGLIAQGAFAMPDCRCAEREAVPPCHQSDPPERSACCAEDAPESAAGTCSTAMQSSCCGADVAPATTTAAVPTTDLGAEDAVVAPASARVPAAVVNRPREAAPPRAPAPPGVPVWLLNSTLRN